MMAKYDGDLTINGDVHKQYLLLVSSHDGSYSLMVQWVTVRVVCANTLSMALSGAKNQVKIRHTSQWEGKSRRSKADTRSHRKLLRQNEGKPLSGLNQQPLTRASSMPRLFTNLLIPASDPANIPTRTSGTNIRNDILARYTVALPTGPTAIQTLGHAQCSDRLCGFIPRLFAGKTLSRLESEVCSAPERNLQRTSRNSPFCSPLDKLLAKPVSAPIKPVIEAHNPFQALLSN